MTHHDVGSSPPPPMPPPVQESSSPVPLIAGIFLLIAGFMTIGLSVYVLVIVDEATNVAGVGSAGADFVQDIVTVCMSIWIFLSIITIIGGIFAMKRSKWGLALLGSIIGLFLIGPYGLASLLSFIALIMIAMYKKEFNE